MNIYVANIAFSAEEGDLKELFEGFGEVSSAKIILDKETRRSRGFGFVEMGDDSEAREAINKLNGSSFQGKTLNVTEARPKTEGGYNRGGGGYGNRNGGGGYGNRGGSGGYGDNRW
jgi:RNA recognition motif-containing protein